MMAGLALILPPLFHDGFTVTTTTATSAPAAITATPIVTASEGTITTPSASESTATIPTNTVPTSAVCVLLAMLCRGPASSKLSKPQRKELAEWDKTSLIELVEALRAQVSAMTLLPDDSNDATLASVLLAVARQESDVRSVGFHIRNLLHTRLGAFSRSKKGTATIAKLTK